MDQVEGARAQRYANRDRRSVGKLHLRLVVLEHRHKPLNLRRQLAVGELGALEQVLGIVSRIGYQPGGEMIVPQAAVESQHKDEGGKPHLSGLEHQTVEVVHVRQQPGLRSVELSERHNRAVRVLDPV